MFISFLLRKLIPFIPKFPLREDLSEDACGKYPQAIIPKSSTQNRLSTEMVFRRQIYYLQALYKVTLHDYQVKYIQHTVMVSVCGIPVYNFDIRSVEQMSLECDNI